LAIRRMELLLIRHALPVRREMTEGPADPELSEQGHAQAELLGAYLASEHLDAIYSSPLNRARQTAEPLLPGRGLEMIIVDAVAEYDRNSTEYIPVEELKAANDQRWHSFLAGDMGDAEETRGEFQQRIVAAIEELVAAHANERIAIVCHGGVINSYLAHILQYADPTGFFYPNYTSINRVAASRSGPRSVVTINETSHLRGSGLPMGLYQKG
jgi:2,3-bisphosphoglycerate-dependent phosphoglycerate mutase